MKRQIITIDEELCNGCGQCIPGCPEGALRIIDGKARLVSDTRCDGLGACIGECPLGAIRIEEREADSYDEKTVMAVIVEQGDAAVQAHLKHLKDHNEAEYRRQALEFLKERGYHAPGKITGTGTHLQMHSTGGCHGSRAVELTRGKAVTAESATAEGVSELRQWPIQLQLINPRAAYFNNADLLIAADCVPFSYAGFHRNLLKGRILIVFCPKLDHTIEQYVEKLAGIFTEHDIASVSIAHMEVPCCFGVEQVVRAAMQKAGRSVIFKEYTISLQGEIIGEEAAS